MQEAALQTPMLVDEEGEKVLQVYGEAGIHVQSVEDPMSEHVHAQKSL